MNSKEFIELYNLFWNFFVKDILRHEGGYVNHPNDTGGETKYGISRRVWGEKVKNVKDLTEYQAFLIYLVEYFLKTFIFDVWLETNNFKVVSKIVDMAINIGVSKAKQIYDKAVAMLGRNSQNTNEFLDVLVRLQKEYYETIVSKNPSQRVFLNGWLKRAEYRGFEK